MLRRFLRTSTYLMVAFAQEKPPGLVGRNFCLAIHLLFAEASSFQETHRTAPSTEFLLKYIYFFKGRE